MTRNEIIEELRLLDDLGLNRDDYCLCYGAAMVMHNLKEQTHDLDITINKRGKLYLKSIGYRSKIYFNGKRFTQRFTIKNGMDLFYTGFMAPVIAVKIDGYYIQTVDSIIVEKTIRGRKKDLIAVASIMESFPDKRMFNR